MKLFKIVITLFLLNSFFAFGQETIKHKVIKGDTFYGIAKKYDLKISEIYSLNPELKDKPMPIDYVLQLPNKKYTQTIVASSYAKTYIVEKGDTFYGIAKKHNITVQNIIDWNPNISSNDLKIGYVLQLKPLEQKDNSELVAIIKAPIEQEVVTEEDHEEFSNDLIHVVKTKETLYGIAKKNNTSVANLKELNPEITGNLPIGYHLILKKGDKPDEVVVAVNDEEITEVEPLDENAKNKADFLTQKASQYIGVRYRSGGTSSAGFDCSGLMCTTFKEIDLILPRTSRSQADFGVKVKRKQAQKGDLIFFATGRKKAINHVGMIIEITNSEIKFIHSSSSVGVIISSLNEPYYSKRFMQISRVLN